MSSGGAFWRSYFVFCPASAMAGHGNERDANENQRPEPRPSRAGWLRLPWFSPIIMPPGRRNGLQDHALRSASLGTLGPKWSSSVHLWPWVRSSEFIDVLVSRAVQVPAGSASAGASRFRRAIQVADVCDIRKTGVGPSKYGRARAAACPQTGGQHPQYRGQCRPAEG